ncbi:MAG TPA: CpXC domain-containing protein [Verrucomicrobiae bacterium]
MSSSIEQSITCPKCGQKQSCTLWESVNVTLNPELKQRVLQRELNQFTCTGCGHGASIATNLLYHDMERKLMLWLVPQADGQAPHNLEIDPKLQVLSESYKLRLLGSYNALLEKIRIFDDGQNDCFVELLKLVVEAQGQNPGNKRLLYGGLREIGDVDPEYQILFLELVKDGPPMEYALPLGEMKELLWERFPDDVFQPISSGQWPVVDRKYAAKCFEEAEP